MGEIIHDNTVFMESVDWNFCCSFLQHIIILAATRNQLLYCVSCPSSPTVHGEPNPTGAAELAISAKNPNDVLCNW
jgi:hypothetical protein